MLILGLTFISTLLFNYVERLILWLTLNTCCRRDRKLHDVVSKNMHGHSARNNKTSIMFTLSMSFMIFSSSSFNIMTSIAIMLSCQLVGSDMKVEGGSNLLNQTEIDSFLTAQMNPAIGAPVQDFCYMTTQINDILDDLSEISSSLDANYITDATNYFRDPVRIRSVPERYLTMMDLEYLDVPAYQSDVSVDTLSNGSPNVIQMLYTNQSIYEY